MHTDIVAVRPSTAARAYLAAAHQHWTYGARVIDKIKPGDPETRSKLAKGDALCSAELHWLRAVMADPKDIIGRCWVVLLDAPELELPDAARRGDPRALPERLEVPGGDAAQQAAVDLALAVLRGRLV